MKKELSPKQRDELLAALKARFERNMARHPGLVWVKVQARLESQPDKVWSLTEMERSGGEPDVVGASRANSFSWIARRKVRLAGAACVTIAQGAPPQNRRPGPGRSHGHRAVDRK